MGYFVLTWNNGTIDDLLNDINGPVGQLLEDLSGKIATVALGAVRYQKPENYSWSKAKSTSYDPWSAGFTAKGIHPKVGYDQAGRLFGGANAPYAPTIWLEYSGLRANDTPRAIYPFLSTGLYSVSL